MPGKAGKITVCGFTRAITKIRLMPSGIRLEDGIIITDIWQISEPPKHWLKNPLRMEKNQYLQVGFKKSR
jgi:hypothetical protein